MGAPVTRLSRLLPRRVRGCAAAAAVACLAVTLTGAGAAQASPGATAPSGLTVQSAGMTVQVAPAGGISSVTFADGRAWQLGGRSLLTDTTDPASADQCTPAGTASATADGGAQWQTTCTDSAGHTTTLAEQLAPADGSVAWTVQTRSTQGTYAKGIWTKLTGWSDSYTRQFWTTWGQSPNSADVRGQNPTWTDPLRPAPFTNMTLPYGGHEEVTPPQNGQNGFAVPVFTITEPGTDHSLSLVQSPADVLLGASLVTDTAGDVQFGRFDNRITAAQPVTFHMNLVPSAADWRGGLGWMTSHSPSYFQPAEQNLANQLSGLDTYSYYPGPFGDSLRSTLHAMDYQTNWEESLHGPYMGEFMPPVSSPDQQFPSFTHAQYPDAPATNSVNDLRQLASRYTDAGLHELGYFNTTEFGTGIQYPQPPPTRQCSDPQLWMSPNDYLYCDFNDAMVRGFDDINPGNPTFSWEGAVVMDPGTADYQQHLLDQAKALLSEVPYSGIDIDRLDWIEGFNPNADDGVSWYNGAPARSLITSWKQLVSRLAPLLHGMGKALFVSPTDTKRIDWMNGIDGFLSEFNNGGTATNLDAFLGLDKPVEGWNYNLGDNPDQFIQRFLYMGVYPMSDTPLNDHGIPTSSSYEQHYKDYGEMFKALGGKQWDLTPHAVTVTGSSALANVFTVPDGAVIPVVQGGTDPSAQVTLRGLAQAKPAIDTSRAEYIQPGGTTWQPLPVTISAAGTVQASVPLSRGAAMVRFLTHTAEQGNTYLADQPVSLNLTSSSQWTTETQPAAITATITNHSQQAVTNVAGTLSQPNGWTVSAGSPAIPELGPGQSATLHWTVTAPDTASGTVQELTAHASYRNADGTQQLSDAQRLAAGPPIPQNQITATATSWQTGQEPSKAVDGDPGTFWQTSGSQQSRPAITLDLGSARNIAGLTYLPRQDGQLNGLTMRYNVYVSSDGTNFRLATSGTWPYDTGLRSAAFSAADVRYVRLETTRGVDGTASAAEINVIEAPPGYPLLTPANPDPVLVAPGASAQVSTAVTNSGTTPATNVSAQLQVPDGWTATAVASAPDSIAAGQSAPLSWRITAPASAAAGAYQGQVTVNYTEGGQHWADTSTILLVTSPPGLVPQVLMTATATSFQPGWPPANAIDGDPNTLWHTEWTPIQAYPPQSITLDLGGSYDVTGLRYLPRQDGYINGIITSYNIYVSQDGTNFTKISSGSWPLDATEKTATFTATNARYIRLEGVQAGANFVSAAEINILGTPAS